MAKIMVLVLNSENNLNISRLLDIFILESLYRQSRWSDIAVLFPAI